MKSKQKIIVTGLILFPLSQTVLAFIGGAGYVSELLDLISRSMFSEINKNSLDSLKDLYHNRFIQILEMNPDPFHPELLGITNFLIYVMGSLYISAIIVIGLYLMFFSGSPVGRARAKSMLPHVVMGMVLVLLAPHLMNPLLYISGSLTSSVLSLWHGDPMQVLNPEGEMNPIDYFMSKFQDFSWFSLEASIAFLFLALLILSLPLIIISIRYLAVTLFTMILPLTIFLYLFLPTRGIGRLLLEQTLLWTSVQVTESVALISVVAIISLLPYNELKIIIEIAGILMLVVVPLITVSFFKNFLP
ncbi:MAG: hypothetical protein DRO76_00445 [Candidatus Altiarchaeales archaeon]|nr:MAG: hypothetical protein DRO76_00445 [Candidatus Altiarchaeales archaeon]